MPACAACDGTRRIDTGSDTAVGVESRLSADLLRDRRQDVDRRRQGVDLAPAVVGDMEAVDAERNGAFGVCGMKHAFQKQWAFPDIPVSCDFVPGKSTATFPANELGGFLQACPAIHIGAKANEAGMPFRIMERSQAGEVRASMRSLFVSLNGS